MKRMAYLGKNREFYEVGGGFVCDNRGRDILTLCVNELETKDAQDIMQCVLKALNEEFKRD